MPSLDRVYRTIWRMLHQLQLAKAFICLAVGSMGLTRLFGKLLDVMISAEVVVDCQFFCPGKNCYVVIYSNKSEKAMYKEPSCVLGVLK